jgi:hypothetical protein
MPPLGFEPTRPVFKRAKTVHALHHAASLIGFWHPCLQNMTFFITVCLSVCLSVCKYIYERRLCPNVWTDVIYIRLFKLGPSWVTAQCPVNLNFEDSEFGDTSNEPQSTQRQFHKEWSYRLWLKGWFVPVFNQLHAIPWRSMKEWKYSATNPDLYTGWGWVASLTSRLFYFRSTLPSAQWNQVGSAHSRPSC